MSNSCQECPRLEHRITVLLQQNEFLRESNTKLKQLAEATSLNAEVTMEDAAVQIMALEAELSERCPRIQEELRKNL
jgi:hypothetical protein